MRMKHETVIPELEDTLDLDAIILERLLDNKWLARLQTINPIEFGQLTPSERRVWASRAERFRKRFEQISNWMCRASGSEPELPEFLRRGAGL